MKKILLCTLVSLSLLACTKDQLSNPLDVTLETILKRQSPNGDLTYFVLPNSTDYSAIPSGKGNPLTTEKVQLGRMLFYETGLAQDAIHESGKGTYSCASCHLPSAGFMPGRVQGIADGGIGFGFNGESRTMQSNYDETELDVQGIRPLSLLNVAYVSNSTWNGKFGANGVNVGTEHLWDNDPSTEVNHLGMDGLESQNIEGLKVHRMVINRELMDELGYTSWFDQAFPDVPREERYSLLTASFAISAYIRTLLPNKAPFQDWLKGFKEQMSDEEKRGAILFFQKAGCYRCHKGPALSSNEFHALGVKDLYQTGEAFNTSESDSRNFGRGGFTWNPEDYYKFKVPQLYNMADSPFYFHGSSKRSLKEVVNYFKDGIAENENVPSEQISPFFHPLNLSDREVDDLVAFLEKSLRDPNLERYVPQEVLSGNCFPNNDHISQKDLGCN